MCWHKLLQIAHRQSPVNCRGFSMIPMPKFQCIIIGNAISFTSQPNSVSLASSPSFPFCSSHTLVVSNKTTDITQDLEHPPKTAEKSQAHDNDGKPMSKAGSSGAFHKDSHSGGHCQPSSDQTQMCGHENE